MSQPHPLYIVASPRLRVGKTLVARLLIEFFYSSDRVLIGYDLNPREPTLAGRFPHLAWPVDITETLGQMELFDRLVADNTRTQIVDLGYAPFEQFFAVMDEIGFVPEARRRLIEPIVLFVTDPTPVTISTYAELGHRLRGVTFVPVHNESVSLSFEKEDFPATRNECGLIHIPRLSPIVRGVIDRPSFSFAAYMVSQPGGPTEVHSWIAKIFAAFRDMELRLLMGRPASPYGAAEPPQPFRGVR
jgi:hypothetical protein